VAVNGGGFSKLGRRVRKNNFFGTWSSGRSI
jgi:hypothetical protein